MDEWPSAQYNTKKKNQRQTAADQPNEILEKLSNVYYIHEPVEYTKDNNNNNKKTIIKRVPIKVIASILFFKYWKLCSEFSGAQRTHTLIDGISSSSISWKNE